MPLILLNRMTEYRSEQCRAVKGGEAVYFTLDGSDVVKKENKSRGMVSRAYPFPLTTADSERNLNTKRAKRSLFLLV